MGAGLIVAAAQGLIAGIAFWLLGFNGPVMWGVATAFVLFTCAGRRFGAGVGSATLWLFLSGEIGRAVILIVVGVLGVGMVDNVLRPLILSGRTSASGLVVFLGLLGGASAFGFIGIPARADHPCDGRQSPDRVHPSGRTHHCSFRG